MSNTCNHKVTPALGTLTLSASDNPDLFKLGRVGLGALGIVSEVTLECMPTHQLHEKMCDATFSPSLPHTHTHTLACSLSHTLALTTQ